MDQWDAPPRTRGFLVAALLTALCGLMLNWDDPTPQLFAPPIPDRAAPGRMIKGQALQKRIPSSAAPAGSLPDAERAELRDAVAPVAAVSNAWVLASGRGAAAWTNASAAKAALAAPGRAAASFSRGTRPYGKGPGRSERKYYLPDGPWRPIIARGTAETSPSFRGAAAPASSSETAPSALPERTGPGRMAKGQAPQNKEYASAGRARQAAAEDPSPADPLESSRQPQADGRRPRPQRTRLLRPALLSRLLGKGALHPPAGAPSAPAKNPWSRPVPRATPDGRAIVPEGPTLVEAESIAPPAQTLTSCRKGAAHWHSDGDVSYLHEGPLWGRARAGRWSWLEHSEGRWWQWPGADKPALLSHEGRWWWESRGAWFLLHDGEPWGYRYLREWSQDGLVHASGAQMVYSADGRRVGIIVPGGGAVLFDAESGAELGRWTEDQMPKRRQPKAPSSLSLP